MTDREPFDVEELRSMPFCVMIGPWRRVTDAAYDEIIRLRARLEAAGMVIEVSRMHIKIGGMRNAQLLADSIAAYDSITRSGEKPQNERDTVGVAGPLDATFNVDELRAKQKKPRS